MAIFRAELGGRPWTVDTASRIRKNWGDCDYERRLIRVSKKAKECGKDREILFHEAIHAIYPDLSEESVTFGARELDKLLSKYESLTE